MARSLPLAAVLLCLLSAGCGQPFSNHARDENNPPSTAENSHLRLHDLGDLSEAVRPPDKVVKAFLVAVREGDNRTTASLLTDRARIETAKHDLVVEPPGTPSAQFVIGDVQYIGENKQGAHVNAHVNTVWTESQEGGTTVTYDVVWALRRQVEGWRVAGIATEIIEGAAPIFLNFEDPGDMLEKWQRAEEIATRHQHSTREAASSHSQPYRR
jgi:hypothetical protein